MTEQQQNQAGQELAWGDRQPPKKSRWSIRKTIITAVIALTVAVMGGAAVYAATGPTPTFGPGGPGGYGGPGRGGGMGPMNAVHGEFTTADGNGGYKTAVMQVGTVTEVSASSLTAKSADDYTKVYTIDAETSFANGSVADIATGDTVTVVATPDGDKATADFVIERGTGVRGGPRGGMLPGQK